MFITQLCVTVLVCHGLGVSRSWCVTVWGKVVLGPFSKLTGGTVCLSVCLAVGLYFAGGLFCWGFLSVGVSLYLSVCLSVRLSVCLSVRMSVCLSAVQLSA